MAESGELVLLQDMAHEPVRMVARPPLGAGQEIDLAVRLLERLANLVAVEPLPPRAHLVGRRAQGRQVAEAVVDRTQACLAGGLPAGEGGSVLVRDGRLMLGTWQGIYFCEFDGPRRRKVWLDVTGHNTGS